MSTAAELPLEPPITMYGIAGRYANALYASAAKKSELLAVEADLKLFKATVDQSPVLRNFVTDPSISRASKAAGVMSLMDSAKAAETTRNALVTLAEGGRMGEVFKVMDLYGDLLTAAKGEVKAVITSAKELPESELAEIIEALKGFQGDGKGNITLTTHVDPGLVNGITIELGDKFIDLSVASQLKKLQALLSDGI
jgi:F-type H+-transporting ATPase subunit O